MKIGLSLFLMMVPGVTFAQPILFRGADTPDAEYRARLKSDEDFRSPVSVYLAQHPLARLRDQVIARFARAQRAFLDGEVGDAHRYFSETVALVPADDWRIEQREMFLNAYLRLAQLEHDESARERWLVEAQYLGEDAKFDPDLFPPPIIKRYRELARQLPRVRPAVEASGWPMLLINGIRCSAADCPTVPAPSHGVRVTYLSDQWVTQTQQVDVAQLSRLRPSRFPWVTGECGRGDLSVAARALGEGRAFFGLACEAPRLAPELVTASVDPVATSLTNPPAPVRRRPFYRSPWVWAGVGAAVIAGVALSLRPAHHHKDEPAPAPPQPTTIYGY